jgi:hypothetical protein
MSSWKVWLINYSWEAGEQSEDCGTGSNVLYPKKSWKSYGAWHGVWEAQVHRAEVFIGRLPWVAEHIAICFLL